MHIRDLKILVVDDSRDGADTLAALLRLQLDCNVATAYSGEAGVEAARDFVPDVVITDFTMPGANGLLTARRILGELSALPPLMLLMTADPVVAEQLDAVDTVFDHAFAKPVDFDRLLQVLERQVARSASRALQTGGFDVFEVLTDSVRQIVPQIKAQGLSFSFDCQGPRLLLRARATALGRGMDRAIGAVVGAVQRGFVSVNGEVRRGDDGDFEFATTVGGTGRLCGDADVTALLRRLALTEVGQEGASATRVAEGVCPETGARLEFRMTRSEGVLLRWRLACPAMQATAAAAAPLAGGALAWLIDPSGEGGAGLVHRLLRMGWRVAGQASCAQALESLSRPLRPSAMPALVVLLDGDGADAARLAGLHAVAGPRVQLVHAATAELGGRTRPSTGGTRPTHSHPFSPAELEGFAYAALQHRLFFDAETDGPEAADDRAALLQPFPGAASRRSVLLVDDSEVNRIVGRALVETLGYDVVTCSDGLDAIVQCGRQAPDVVLMDIDMAVLNGYDATRRLRQLQATGRLPHFTIVACTAQERDGDRFVGAGLDGFLQKPLDRERLAAELARPR